MPRRSTPKREKRDWRWYASFALNAFVAAAMVLGSVLVFTGVQPAAQVPTIVPPTAAVGGATPTPASAPTTASPAPTATPAPSPKPEAHNLSSPDGLLAQNIVAVGIPTATMFSYTNVKAGSS